MAVTLIAGPPHQLPGGIMLHRALTRLVQIVVCLALALTGTAVGLATVGSAAAAPVGTEVTGALTADTTWTAANSPYVFTGTVDVPAGITLTVEAGVELRRATYTPDKLLRVAGTLKIQGTEAAPVVASNTNYCCDSPQLVAPAAGQTDAAVLIEGLHTVNPFAIGDGTASFAQVSITDSKLEGVRVNLDNAVGDVLISRNTFSRGQAYYYNSDVAALVANPRPGHVTISDNRFRDAGFGCKGAGRLAASGNTLERSISYPGSQISSADDCLLDASGNYWEAPDSQLGNRVIGSARVIVTPSSSAPSADTPALAPAANQAYRAESPEGRATLRVDTSSDGGLATTLVATATNRETGEVTETQTRAQPSWRTSTSETFTFTQLTPGTLYRLSSYAENASGRSMLRETESFIAPSPTAPAPDEDGTSVRGTLLEDTTWTAADGPYVFNGTLTVPEGVRLTIEAGAVLIRAKDSYFQTFFSVSGEVLVNGTSSAPVLIQDPEDFRYMIIFESASPMARFDISGLESKVRGEMLVSSDQGSSTPRVSLFSLKDSRIAESLAIDTTAGAVSLVGNVFAPGANVGRTSLTITNPRADDVEIRDNRFRDALLSCAGAGRLTIAGNTFEPSSGLASNDDCIVNASGNFWESTDAEAAQRIDGRARVTLLPTLDAPTEETPELAPARHSQYDYLDDSGRGVLDVYPGSDGGLTSTIVATATNRETGEVEQTMDAPVGSWRTDNTARFVFDNLTPGALYRLSSYVENALGRSTLQESQSFLAPERAPSAPQDVRATGSGTSATITWTAPATDNGNAITGYTVTSQSGDQTTVGPDARSATITDLAYSTAYTFTVTATSAAGTSPASSPSNTVTTGAAPSTGGGGGGGGTPPPTTPPTAPPTTPPADETKAPEAPTGVTSSPGDESATVSWTPGDDNGDPITGFTVTRFPGGITTSASAGSSSVTVPGLTNGTAYTFTVSASNATGTSAASAPSAPLTPAGRPSSPSVVTAKSGNRSATVSWTAAESNGSPVTGYTVTASPGGASTTVGAQQTSATIDGLANGTAYTLVVTATNGVGSGAASAPSVSVTPAGAPGRVAKPLARLQRLGIVLTWTAPASNGSEITGYIVTMSTGRTFTVGPNARKLVLQRVRANTKLRFTVLAVSEVGRGRTSEWSNIVVRKKG